MEFKISQYLSDASFLDIHYYTFIELRKIVETFNENSNNISEKLLIIVEKFNNYLDIININNHFEIIYKLLKAFEQQQKQINSELNLADYIKINNSNIIEYLLDTVNMIEISTISANSTLIYYFSYSIYKSILILYTYEYYLKIIDTFIKRKNKKIFKDEYEYYKYFINFILNYNEIITNNDDEDDEEDDEDEDEDKDEDEVMSVSYKQINNRILNIIYSKIIQKFLKEQLNITNKQTLSINSINTIGDTFTKINFRDEESKIKILNDLYKKRGIYWKLIIKNYLIINKISISDNFVTIPQYKGICWYISILTGMCYSDASRKLIESKISKLSSEIETKTDADKNFNNTIIYIIETITSKQLKYDSKIYKKCDIFRFFKIKLPEFLELKYKEIEKDLFDNPKKIIELSKGNRFTAEDNYYFINIFIKKHMHHFKMINPDLIDEESLKSIIESIKSNIKSDKNIDEKYTGITIPGFFLLNTLYQILNISSLYFLKIDSTIYKKNNVINPDVIVIHKISSQTIDNFDGLISASPPLIFKYESDLYRNDEEEIINYNGNNYKLDYVLYANTYSNGVCRLGACGHCISGLNYHGNKYYYDSGHYEKSIVCNDESSNENIRIPCTLTKQNWSIRKMELPFFTINKCFYRDVKISNDLEIEKDYLDESERTFDNDDIICVYIKVVETIGGKNNYKFTHKKKTN